MLITTNVVARIANPIKVSESHNKFKYIRILAYIVDEDTKQATLLPILFYGALVKKVSDNFTQGNLIAMQVKISANIYKEYINPSLTAISITHLESTTMRSIYEGDKEAITHLFPYVPNNYSAKNENVLKRTSSASKRKINRDSKSVNQKEKFKEQAVRITPIVDHQTVDVSNKITKVIRKKEETKKGSQSKGQSSDWFSSLDNITSFSFPKMK